LTSADDPGSIDDMHIVQAFDEQADLPIDLDEFVDLARHVLRAERFGSDAELTLLFVDERTMAEYHERFLDEPGPTDVMAFPMDEDLPTSGRSPDNSDRGPGSPADQEIEPPAILGDVMVCPAFAAREAAARQVAVFDELRLLVVHGVLHLLNYSHDERSDEEVMLTRQYELLAEFAAARGETVPIGSNGTPPVAERKDGR
jgi:probable rRNA maturation factor